jgi:hypothetical protein
MSLFFMISRLINGTLKFEKIAKQSVQTTAFGAGGGEQLS